MAWTIREATIDDVEGIARVRVDSWRRAYAGLIDRSLLDGLDAQREAEHRRRHWAAHHADARSCELVAVTDAEPCASAGGEVIGWAVTAPNRRPEPAPNWGEFCALYAHPSRWGTGVGHALMVAAEQELRAAGFERALLWVLDGNERAARFYEAHGWREDGGVMDDERTLASGEVVVLRERRRVRSLR